MDARLDADTSLDGFPSDVSVDGPDMDAPSIDAVMGDAVLPCSPTPEPGGSVIAHWNFDDAADPTMFGDAVGGHVGRIQGTPVPRRPTGRDGCGNAMAFEPSAPPVYGIVAASMAFELPSGSVELWVKVPAHEAFGILSRDESDADEPGHFGILVSDGGHIIARVQGGGGETWACAFAPAPIGIWIHVAVSWGPLGFELWIDDIRQMRTGPLTYTDGSMRSFRCGDAYTGGIDGNGLPFYFGVSSALNLGTGNLTLPFVNGEIDDVILRDERWSPSL